MGLSLVGARIERTCNGYFLRLRIPKRGKDNIGWVSSLGYVVIQPFIMANYSLISIDFDTKSVSVHAGSKQFASHNDLAASERSLGLGLAEAGGVHQTPDILQPEVGQQRAGNLGIEVLQLQRRVRPLVDPLGGPLVLRGNILHQVKVCVFTKCDCENRKFCS